MIAYNSNAHQILDVFTEDLLKLQSAERKDKLLRRIATTLTAVMHKRVHVDGLDSNEEKIGTYSKGYMAVRTGEYQNSERVSRGKDKGKVKNAGVSRKGIVRKKYNRNSDTKVILSLTRQMEIDLSVCEQNPIQTSYGYAIGYQNDFNYNKLIWNEARYKKPILTELSHGEEDLIDLIVTKELEDVRANSQIN